MLNKHVIQHVEDDKEIHVRDRREAGGSVERIFVIARPKEKAAEGERDRAGPDDLEVLHRHDGRERECADQKEEILLQRVLRDASVDFHRAVFRVAQGINRLRKEPLVPYRREHDKKRQHRKYIGCERIREARCDRVGNSRRRKDVEGQKSNERKHSDNPTCGACRHHLLFVLHGGIIASCRVQPHYFFALFFFGFGVGSRSAVMRINS